MGHCLGSKKNKLRAWKAYRRETSKHIDWECGDRVKETFKRLIDRLLQWGVKRFGADYWEVCQDVPYEDRLFQSMAKTYYLEQNNSRPQHWYSRLRRKTSVDSKTLERVALTLDLFARFHVIETGKISYHY